VAYNGLKNSSKITDELKKATGGAKVRIIAKSCSRKLKNSDPKLSSRFKILYDKFVWE